MGCLYMLEFAGGKRYIGITERTIDKRIAQHRRVARAGSNLAVHSAWRVHGEPKVRVLTMASAPYLYEIERSAIASYGVLAPSGYNVCTGGETAPSKSPVVAAKIAASLRGKTIPDAVRSKIRLGNLGKKMSTEAVAKTQAARKANPGFRARISATLMGHAVSNETRRKIGLKSIGRVPSAETRLKLSAANLGKKRSLGTRAALSAAIKKWHAGRRVAV